MTENREGKAASSIFFKLGESVGRELIVFVVNIVLARLLDPADHGVLTMLTVFISLAQVFVQSGLNTALVQKKEADETDCSSVFYAGLLIAVGCYGLLFFAAPAIAAYFEMPELTATLRVLALILIPGAFVMVEDAVVARRMLFRKSMLAGLLATLFSGVVGVGMAWAGMKHWALVGQQLTNTLLQAVLLMVLTKWHPKWLFSWQKLKGLLSFGWRILVSSLLDTGYNQLRTAVIGKKYATDTLGSYNKGRQFPELVMSAVNTSVQSVMLPVLSQQQENRERMREILRRSLMTACFLVFPLMAGLSAVATPLVTLLLTEKWLPCVPFLQICCIDYAFYPVHTFNLQAVNAMGRSDLFLKLELVKKSYGILLLVGAVFLCHSVEAIVWSGVISTCLSLVVNAWPNGKLLGYGFSKQWRDLLPILLSSVIMFVAVLALGQLNLPTLPLLCVQVAAGVGIYGGLSILFRVPALKLVKEMLPGLLKKGGKQ